MSALWERQTSGKGQVVDAAMVDGAATLMTMFHAMTAMGVWSEGRGTNLLDTGAHFYDVYETADGLYVSIGSIEPQFYAELLRLTGLEGEDLPWQLDRAQWPAMKERLAVIFRTKTRDEWCAGIDFRTRAGQACTDEQQELAGAFGIQSIPSVLFVPMEGKPQMAVGALPTTSFKEVIDKELLGAAS